MTDDSTHAQAKTPPPQPNPALKPLEGLVGNWEMELSHASFLPRPSGRVKGGPVLIVTETQGPQGGEVEAEPAEGSQKHWLEGMMRRAKRTRPRSQQGEISGVSPCWERMKILSPVHPNSLR